jgi:hypothetical protein
MKDFNLAGLFRNVNDYASGVANRTGKWPSIDVIIPECDKDEFIASFTDTRFIQERSPIKRAGVPMTMQLGEITVYISASEGLESGTVIITEYVNEPGMG